MDDWYEIKELANDWYLEFQSDATGWNPKAIKLTDAQAQAYIEFEEMQAQQKHIYLKQLAGDLI